MLREYPLLVWQHPHQSIRFELTTLTQSVTVNQLAVSLTESEFWVLYHLLRYTPFVRPAALIYRDIYGHTPQNDSTIKVHLSRAKKKINAVSSEAAALMQWVRGRGPRFSDAQPYPHHYWDQAKKLSLLHLLDTGISVSELSFRYHDLNADELEYWQFRRTISGDDGLRFSKPIFPRPRKKCA